MSGPPLISADGVSFRYLTRSQAVGPFDFEAQAGEFHLISGPSGCGKSTLARVLSGLIPHLYRGDLEGAMHIAGRRSDAVPLWQLSALVGFVSQNPAAQLLGSSVADEIVFGLENLGLTATDIEIRLQAALAAFGLDGLATRDPRTLSGGEQQKLILAAVTA
ncbi:MAG TPA: ABC transporter ATP-binding protein, partial [Candidatus Acidoferrales bacterium]|nr:ABC transporter ATP-binding protein [Candidatus Acidoferrales bacterium]